MHMARKILVSICPHIVLDKTSFFGGKDWSDPLKMFEGPYLFLLRRKLRVKVHGHRETELQRQSNIFPFSPITERSRMGGNFFGIIR